MTGHRHLLAALAFATAAATPGLVGAQASPWTWDVTAQPPTLESPTLIDVSAVQPIRGGGFALHCDGLYRRISLAENEDAIVYMSGTEPLTYPLHVTGGRNVRIVGIDIDIETQPGCDVGDLPNSPAAEHPNANVHPRIPTGIVMRLQQSGTTFVEGVKIDLRGHEADCFVLRNPDSMTSAEAINVRHMTLQNTYCSGVEGLGASSGIGDGVHGDLFQNQGGDIFARLIIENVSMRTSQEGIVIHGADGMRSQEFELRRYDYAWDVRYSTDDSYESFGLAFAGTIQNFTFESVWIDDGRGNNYGILNNQRYGNSSASTVQPHPEISSGLPATTHFAPPQHTGVNYISPHAGLPGTNPPPVLPPPPQDDPVAALVAHCTATAPNWELLTPTSFMDPGGADSATVRVAWTPSALAVRVDVTDANISIDPTLPVWKNDSVEIFVDPTFDGISPIQGDDVQFQIRADDGVRNRTVGDGNGSVTAVPIGGFVGTASATPTGYVVIATLPWSELGLDPGDGMSIGFLIGVNDREGQSATHYASQDVTQFLLPDAWGELVLTGPSAGADCLVSDDSRASTTAPGDASPTEPTAARVTVASGGCQAIAPQGTGLGLLLWWMAGLLGGMKPGNRRVG